MQMLNGPLRFATRTAHLVGGSVEDVKYGKPRIEHLRQNARSVLNFWSIGPLLEDSGRSESLTEIDWVIVGGESGPGRAQWKKHGCRAFSSIVESTKCRSF